MLEQVKAMDLQPHQIPPPTTPFSKPSENSGTRDYHIPGPSSSSSTSSSSAQHFPSISAPYSSVVNTLVVPPGSASYSVSGSNQLKYREEKRQQVFQPHWTLPTYSVEEALEFDILSGKVKLGTGESSKPKPKGLPEDEEDQDSDDDKEDDKYYDDRKVYEAREWDEFKDDNPVGSGNRYRQG
eukprot:TRINITY_DN1140_c0_g1_i1.p1 TRINITY_DN1140_c0_g1~~TRINITY_DN1140_c0_g1_i1.p1  ORF type:complete len:183 (-),score=49.66 TRINITY_DN1140_c0_g1_i1:86-634(-)